MQVKRGPVLIYVGEGEITFKVSHWEKLDPVRQPRTGFTALVYRDPANHKGQKCIVDPTVLCQESYCSGCWLAIQEPDRAQNPSENDPAS